MSETPTTQGPLARVYARLRRARARSSVLDHAVRTVDRNSDVLASRWAGAITYFGFLSFFPLLALAFAVVGYVSDSFPGAQDAVTTAVADIFPSLIGSGDGQINIQDVIDAKAGAGLLGLLGLLYSGLGWVDALRDGLRRVFGTLDERLGFVAKKLGDVIVLVLLGISLIASVVVTSLATAVTEDVLGLVDLQDSLVATGLLRVLSVTLALAADTVLFAILISRLSGARLPWSRVRSGAVLGAVGFEVLKLLATFLIGRATGNPVYATFGVVVGLLVWMNLLSRLILFAAAWTATLPYSLEPAGIGQTGVGQRSGFAAASEPVTVVAPPDFEQQPGGIPAAGPRSPRRRWRSLALGAAAGAGVAAALTRRLTGRE
jgi:membrane protein